MPSIIEGYNNDIFISYRQKDNKGDRWVSEFVKSHKLVLSNLAQLISTPRLISFQ